jgi:DNA-binding NarL/FixJ family response regulator
METAPASVLVVHEDCLVAAGLVAVLRTCANLLVHHVDGATIDASLGGAGSTERHDVVVADYRSAMAWLSATSASANRQRNTKVLILAPVIRESEVRTALRLGARGYLQQGCPADEVIDGVRLVAIGSTFLSRAASQCIADGMTYEPLTAREREVLDLIIEGLCNKDIARELGISLGTVKTHVKGVLEKLGATTRTHAVAVATRRGLCGPQFDNIEEARPFQVRHRGTSAQFAAA